MIGEFRGFTADGKEALGIGNQNSWNYDLFATDLQTGASRRLTRDPGYTDPMKSSPDDQWSVVMDGRTTHRLYFLGALPGVPPLIDFASAVASASLYNGPSSSSPNGAQRFFEPILIDRYGDRGNYHGQQLNAGGDATPGSGSISDPLWAGRADPTWSPDGTAIVYWQSLVTAPACGPSNPNLLTCPTSSEPGGRRTRLMIASLTSRTAQVHTQPAPVSDEVPWGVEYHGGDAFPQRYFIPAGTYTLRGNSFGLANVTVTENSSHTADASVAVTYHDYSNDGITVLNGTESVSQTVSLATFTTSTTFVEDLHVTGCHTGSKLTSDGGFNVTQNLVTGASKRTGTLTTTVDGNEYSSPPNGA